MAKGDDIINIIIILSDTIGAVAKGIKKLLTIIRRKSKGIRKPINIE